MSFPEVFLVIVLGLHLVAVIFYCYKLFKTNLFTKKQKAINIILLMTVPLIWAILIHYLLKRELSSYEVKVKNDRSSNGFYESGIGITGGPY